MTSLASPATMRASSSSSTTLSLRDTATHNSVAHHQVTSDRNNISRSAFELPNLRIPSDSEVQEHTTTTTQHSSSSSTATMETASHYTRTTSSNYYYQNNNHSTESRSIHMPAVDELKNGGGSVTSSPSSPSGFFDHADSNKFGLTHLLEAAEQVRRPNLHPHNSFTFTHEYRPQSLKRVYDDNKQTNHNNYNHQHQDLPSIATKMHSIGYLIDNERAFKRARPDVSVDLRSSYQLLGTLPHQQQPDFHHQHPLRQQQQQPQQTMLSSFQVPSEEIRSPVHSAGGSISPGTTTGVGGVVEPHMVWETVLASGKFPQDICLSENTPSTNGKSSTSPTARSPVKQGRWTCDEKEFAEALIQSVRSGEAVLPPNVSLRKFIADSLQCKAMRVSKKFRSLRACHSPQNTATAEEADSTFNPLSLKSIMNNDNPVEEEKGENAIVNHVMSPAARSINEKKNNRVLKRSDYSQHGVVRSGRWSIEEENYAKAMIEAFKAGYLPLHGNVSLRKFLSEVLVCHPMRISKKFVGYVRKYHWYRIAAGKCDPEARRQALQHLSHLERIFWASLQQTNEWTGALRQEEQ